MGKRGSGKRRNLEGSETKQPVSVEKADSAILSGRRGSAISLFLIATMALLIYSNTFSVPFSFDDHANIGRNIQLRDLKNFWPPSGTRYIGYLSFAINFYFGGLDVSGYHLINIIVHIINGMLVWWLVILTLETPRMKMGGDSRLKGLIALTSALIFVSHPVQTQGVTYIIQRFASLATLFYLLSLIMYVKARLRGATSSISFLSFYLLSLSSAILAMKTKEISFTLPFVIVLYEFTFMSPRLTKGDENPSPPDKYFGGKLLPSPLMGEGWVRGDFRMKRLLYLIPFLTPLLIGLPVGIVGVDNPLVEIEDIGDIIEELGKVQASEHISRGVYLLTQFRVIVTYIRLLFLPTNQNLDYDYPLYGSFLKPEVFLSFLFLLLIFGLAAYLFVRARKSGSRHLLLVSFGILWFFITLSVESSIIPIEDVIFEHRLYLPSVGAVIAFGAAVFYVLDHAKSKASPRTVTCLLLLVTAVPLGIATYNRNWVWRDGVTLWKDVVRKSPNKARPHFNLGGDYYKLGRIDEAVEEYRKTLEVDPKYLRAHYNLGVAYYKLGRMDEAMEEYRKTLEVDPKYLRAHYNLGVAYYKLGRMDEAITEYKEALKLTTSYPEAHYNLGIAYDKLGRMDEAITEYKEALKLTTSYPEAHYNLGVAYYKLGRIDEAVEEYKKALGLKPDLPRIKKLEGL